MTTFALEPMQLFTAHCLDFFIVIHLLIDFGVKQNVAALDGQPLLNNKD